jgi:hypothetical protein
MNFQTYFAQFEDDHRFVEGEYQHRIPRHKTINDYDTGKRDTGCIVFPVTVTTEHAQSSYGQPVIVDSDGHVYGPGDLQGHIQLYEEHAEHISALENAGWELPRDMGADDVSFLDGEGWDDTEQIENGEPIPNAPFPDARLVAF